MLLASPANEFTSAVLCPGVKRSIIEGFPVYAAGETRLAPSFDRAFMAHADPFAKAFSLLASGLASLDVHDVLAQCTFPPVPQTRPHSHCCTVSVFPSEHFSSL